MFKDNYNKKSDPANPSPVVYSSKVQKLTALWALSESTLGGVLHAIRFPFRGIIISSFAIILISMIGTFMDRRGIILKSAILVIAAKAIISPYTPFTAHISVLLQGILGEIFFLMRRFRFILSVLFGVTVSLINGFQKILVLTLIYGAALWSTINDFLNYIIKDWFVINTTRETDYSLIIISLYVGIHLAAGLFTGILAYYIPKEVTEKLGVRGVNFALFDYKDFGKYSVKKKRLKIFKPTSVMIFLMGIIIIIISYFHPVTDRFNVTAVVIMLIRAMIIMILWFLFISPIIVNYIQKKFYTTQNRYSKEVEILVSTLPAIKEIIYSIWKSSSSHKGFKRLYHFIIYSLIYTLNDENESKNKAGFSFDDIN